ncbi:MAG: prepilin-type N-terminal cleavage/methylation domain-containing protein [Blastocatellia bacterium]
MTANHLRQMGVARRETGFSLIELLVVIAIIGIVAAIATPGLKRARQHAHSGSATQSMRTLTTAEYSHQIRTKTYATLATLHDQGLIQSDLATGDKSGYIFTLTLAPDAKTFVLTATPKDDPGILDHFYVDESGIIRFNTGAPADVNSAPIPR